MNENDYKLKVSKFLEYTIFMNHPISVSPGLKTGTKKVLFNVVDVEEDSFFIEPISESNLAMDIHATYLFVGTLNNEQVSFSSEVIDKNQELASPRFRIKLPTMGLVKNLRSDRRVSLSDLKSEKHQIEIETRSAQKITCTFRPIDINKSALSIMISREVGLVLPGDKVQSVKLVKGDQVLLQSYGKVLRVELPEPQSLAASSVMADEAMLVISLAGALVEKAVTTSSAILDFIDDNEDSAYCFFKTSMSGDTTLRAKILSINSGHVRLEIINPKSHLMPGLTINHMQIFLPLLPPFEVSSIISSVAQSNTERGNEHILELVFPKVPTEMHKAIMSLSQARQNRNLHDLHPEDHGDLWRFLFETGFIYPAKRKQLQEYGKEVLATYKALLTENNPLVKKVVYKENNRIKGHLSAVRFFDNTWIIQHLNALKVDGGTSAAREVLGAIVSFFVDGQINKKNSTSFISCYYRPNNLYPSMLFGETHSLVNNKDICDYTDLRFCLMTEKKGDTSLDLVNPDISTGPATKEDLVRLERLLVNRGLFALMRIENLTREKFLKLDVSTDFERLGLYRYRKIFTARDKSNREVYAICNFASPGVNLSELTNSTRFYFSDPEETEANKKLVDAVTPHFIREYETTRFRHPVLLLEENQPLPGGFTESKIYRYWHFDAQNGELFRNCAQTIFENLRATVAKYARICGEKDAA